MRNDGLRDELQGFIEPFFKEQNIELVELIYRYEGRDIVLRVLADRPEGGITMEECAFLSRQISAMLDEKDLIAGHYTLEVSSPGLDRPLQEISDFCRCLNKPARFFLREKIEGKLEHAGIIKRVEGGIVYVDIEGKVIEIPVSKIVKAKQEIG